MITATSGYKITQANDFKTIGNQLFKQNEFKKALSQYHKVFLYTKGLIIEADSQYDYAREDLIISKSQQEHISELHHTTYLNISLCHYKLGNYKKSTTNATLALQFRDNVKAYFRRGLAYIKLQKYEKAEDDLSKALEQSPQDKQILKELEFVQQQREKELESNSQLNFFKQFVYNQDNERQQQKFEEEPQNLQQNMDLFSGKLNWNQIFNDEQHTNNSESSQNTQNSQSENNQINNIQDINTSNQFIQQAQKELLNNQNNENKQSQLNLDNKNIDQQKLLNKNELNINYKNYESDPVSSLTKQLLKSVILNQADEDKGRHLQDLK